MVVNIHTKWFVIVDDKNQDILYKAVDDCYVVEEKVYYLSIEKEKFVVLKQLIPLPDYNSVDILRERCAFGFKFDFCFRDQDGKIRPFNINERR